MTWCIEISGEAPDLFALSQSLTTSRATITQDAGTYLLTSAEFDQSEDPATVRDSALRLLEEMSGAARILLGMPTSLRLERVFRIDAAGRKHHYAFPEPARMVFRVNNPTIIIGRPGQEPEVQRPADAVRRLLDISSSHLALAKALRLRNRTPLEWSDLYRIVEVVRGAVTTDAIVEKRWVSLSDLRRFEHSANSVGATGDEARHGVERTQPPAKPMSVVDARMIVDRILDGWLRELAS